MTGEVIFYGIKGERFQTLLKVANELDLGLVPASDDDLDRKVGDLLVDPKDLNNDGLDLPDFQQDIEYMLLAIPNQDVLFHFLDSLQDQGVYIPIKAGLTANNRHWTLGHLIKENRKEHEYMQKMARKKQEES